MKSIPQRLSDIRSLMAQHKLAAYIIPSNDPHFSEYVADRWKCREWLSGFTGSAGTLVVTTISAALWTDSRYFIQAEAQLKGSGIELMRMGLPDVPSIEKYIGDMVEDGQTVGVDGRLFSVSEFERLSEAITPIKLKATVDLVNPIWSDRPGIPQQKAFLLPESVSGMSTASKLQQLVKAAHIHKDDIMLLSALDEVAWLFNLRGADIAYNPLALAYAAVYYDKAVLFMDAEKLTAENQQVLTSSSIHIRPYEEFEAFVERIDITRNVVITPRKTNILVRQKLQQRSINIAEDRDTNGTATSLKAVKNEVEIAGFRHAMELDGVALVRFYIWLEESLGNEPITELSIAAKQRELRAMSDEFLGESFGTIAGYRSNGALPHYSATEASNAEVKREGFLLIDSGGQYKTGTTDITRTVHLGTPTHQEKVDYTLVLKGHIALSMAVFPSGTRGSQLDILARGPMMQHGINYGHGTGHGVGHVLNVHEGPQSIRMQENPVTMKPGMVTSNEPALYRPGAYGIRTENCILCVPYLTNEFGAFERFEAITLCPIDTTPIERSMLTPDEVAWLNSYHQLVFEKLSPHLNEKENEWLKAKTAAI
jgi:Xaa-Pro aminopeptidase